MLVKTTCWHLLCVHSPAPRFSHYANPTIIYLGVLKGLTQVMLQVKGCEMVCKQRESIPRLSRLSPPSSYLPLPSPPPFLPLLSPLSGLSNSLRQPSGLSEAIKKVPRHRRKCHSLTKMRVNQDQYWRPQHQLKAWFTFMSCVLTVYTFIFQIPCHGKKTDSYRTM